MIFLTSLENILPIILIIALGYFLQVRGWFSDQFSGNISKLIMKLRLCIHYDRHIESARRQARRLRQYGGQCQYHFHWSAIEYCVIRQ